MQDGSLGFGGFQGDLYVFSNSEFIGPRSVTDLILTTFDKDFIVGACHLSWIVWLNARRTMSRYDREFEHGGFQK